MKRFFPTLFSPIKIGKVTARNRIETAPTLTPLIDSNGYPTDHFVAYYRNKAKGGAGIVTIGETAIDWEYAKTHACQLNLYGERAGMYLANVVDAIHQYGALANIELCHGGVYGDTANRPIGPSACVRADGVEVDEISREQMDEVAETFARAAVVCKTCGFDLVMIHGAHGWLLGAFMSPIFNKRKDEYGGSLENRCRYPLEVLRRVREAVGPDFPIEYRISGSELVPEGSTIDDAIYFLQKAAAEGLIDMAHISVGTRADLHGRGVAHPACFLPHGCNAYLAKAVKASGLNIPVVALGAMDDPQLAEDILERGEADMIAIARGCIADPEFPNKARRGQVENIVPCIRCFHCLDRSVGRDNKDAVLRFNRTSTHRFTCAVNPHLGNEHYPYIPPAVHPRKIAVIGGGPAGMYAAVEAAERGHDVTLYEEKNVLGGALVFSEKVSFKADLCRFKNYLIHRVGELNIKVKLGIKATEEMLEQGRYDAVIAAVGANPVVPPIPGINGPNVIMATESYYLPEKVGKRIVIVGGGQVGCETGLHFAMAGKEVTIIEMQSLIAPDASFTHRLPLLEQLEAHTTMVVNRVCEQITEDGVTLRTPEGTYEFIPADTVIIAAGMRSRTQEAESFRETALDYYQIGDCVKPGTVHEAVKTGYDTAIQL